MNVRKLRNLLESLAIKGLIYVEYYEDSQDELYKIKEDINVLFKSTPVLHFSSFDNNNKVVWFSDLIKNIQEILVQHKLDKTHLT